MLYAGNRPCPHEHGLVLACGSSDGSVAVLRRAPDSDVWTAATFVDNKLGVNAVSWAPHGALGATAPGTQDVAMLRLAVGGCDNAVRIYALRSDDPTASLTGAPALQPEHAFPRESEQWTTWAGQPVWAPVS